MVRVTDVERRWLQEVAGRRDLAVGRLLVECVEESEDRWTAARTAAAARAQEIRLDLLPARAELGKIGSNVNQIARVLNSGRSVNLVRVEQAMSGVVRAMDAINSALMGREL